MNYHYVIASATIILIWSLWLWRYEIKPRFAENNLNLALKKRSDWKRIKKTERLLSRLYISVHADRISIKERKRLNIEKDDFIYGEIEFLSFFGMLLRVNPQEGEVFYDLGSGSGKAVFTAALYFDLRKSYGIELLPGFVRQAEALIQEAQTLTATHDKNYIPVYLGRLKTIQFVCADMLQYDFSDADIIYINGTCFGYYTWEALLAKLMHLKPGVRLIVCTKKIEHDDFKLLYSGREVMSWGLNSVRIYQKIN